jgi:hypothetical protein
MWTIGNPHFIAAVQRREFRDAALIAFRGVVDTLPVALTALTACAATARGFPSPAEMHRLIESNGALVMAIEDALGAFDFAVCALTGGEPAARAKMPDKDTIRQMLVAELTLRGPRASQRHFTRLSATSSAHGRDVLRLVANECERADPNDSKNAERFRASVAFAVEDMGSVIIDTLLALSYFEL